MKETRNVSLIAVLLPFGNPQSHPRGGRLRFLRRNVEVKKGAARCHAWRRVGSLSPTHSHFGRDPRFPGFKPKPERVHGGLFQGGSWGL